MSADKLAGPPELDVDLTISIVTWNSRADIAACLAALPAAAGELSTAVTVVDNQSPDGTAAYVREAFPQVQVIEMGENAGFSAGHNRAIAAGVGRYHLVLNPDTRAMPGAFATLVAFLRGHPEAAFAGPQVLEKDGSVYPSCRQFPTPGALLFRNKLLAGLFPHNPYTRGYLMGDFDHSKSVAVGWLSGAALMTSREALDVIGLLDDRFFMYCEDMDWCLRAHQAGLKVYYVPQARLVHLRARSTDQRIPSMILEHHQSMWKYYLKHEAPRRSLLWSAGAAVMIGLRAGLILSRYYLLRLTGKALRPVASSQ